MDASALVKLYIREDGTQQVQRLYSEKALAISRLSEIEVTSALARRHREGAIDQSQLDMLLDELDQDVQSLLVVELSLEVLVLARRLLKRHPLRAADALQLASAMSLADQLGHPVRMVAFDHRLVVSATVEGLDVMDLR